MTIVQPATISPLTIAHQELNLWQAQLFLLKSVTTQASWFDCDSAHLSSTME